MPDPLDALYRDLACELEALGPVCAACGRCCHFDEVDHVLYASALERERLAALAGPASAAPPGRCPWQEGANCRAREGRLLGCRLHFCRLDPAQRERLEEISERYHRRLRALHEEAGREWEYRRILP